MLKLKYMIKNVDLARMALQRWPHDEATLEERLQQAPPPCNGMYPYDWQGEKCYLRLLPALEITTPQIREELRYLALLQREGYPAPRPIPALDGEYIQPLRTPWGMWYACAFRGMPGIPLAEAALTEEAITRYGEALGELHRATMEITIPPDRPNFLAMMRWIRDVMEDAPNPLYRECFDVREELLALPRGPFTLGMIHGAFTPEHVLWDGQRSHVIGFDDCMVHFYALDVVIALDALPPEAVEPFLRGYYNACPESGVKESDFPLMRRFRQLHQYAQIMYALSERPSPEPAWLSDLAARQEGTMNALGAQITQERKARKRRPWERKR